MAFSSVATVAVGNHATSASSWTAATLSAQLSADNIIALILATDNVDTTDTNSTLHSSIAIGSLNLTKVGERTKGSGAAAAGCTGSVWVGRAAGNISSGTSIGVTLASAVVSKALTAWQFSTAAAVSAAAGGVSVLSTTSNGASVSISGLASKEYLFVRGYALEHVGGTTIVPTTNYTAFTATGATETSLGMGARGEWRILTATGDTSTCQDNAGSGEDRAIVYAALEESSGSVYTKAGFGLIGP